MEGKTEMKAEREQEQQRKQDQEQQQKEQFTEAGSIAGEKCIVIGSGISGIGSLELLEYMGAEVILYDGKEGMTERELCEKLPLKSNAVCMTGELPEKIREEIRTVVLSPGVPVDIPLVKEFQANGAEIIGEIELGYREEKGRVLKLV